jgi:hypothetical protein
MPQQADASQQPAMPAQLHVAQPAAKISQWIAKQQLARQGTKCFWRLPVGQQKSAQLQEGISHGISTRGVAKVNFFTFFYLSHKMGGACAQD